MIPIEFYGQFRAAAGVDGDSLEAGQPLHDGLTSLAEKYSPAFKAMLLNDDGSVRLSVIILVNGQPVSKRSYPTLREGDEIRLMSAIAGG